MEKTKRFIVTSVVLSLGFLGINFLENQYRFVVIGVLTALTIILYFWSLFEGLDINATLLSVVLPCFFTLGVGLFWFLLPVSIFTRVPVLILYALGNYVLCSTSNIFVVSATIRTIPLLRAAKGLGFILTLLVSFLLFDTVLSLKASVWVNMLLIFIICMGLFLQGFWTSNLEIKLNKNVLIYSVMSSLGVVQIAAILYFWPLTVISGSLFLTVAVYILLGLGQAHLEERLFKHIANDYLVVAALVLIVTTLFSTHWGG